MEFHSHPVSKCGTCFFELISSVHSRYSALKVLRNYSEKLFLVDR